MSTVALWSADAGPTDVVAKAKPSFLQRLMRAREREARQRILHYLLVQPDERLLALGYSPEAIKALRQR